MKEVLPKLKRIFFVLAVVAFFINLFLFIFANIAIGGDGGFELSILAIGNMMLLSFALLREPNQKS